MEEKIEKIVVKSKDELIDIVREISNTEAKKILVSFVEDSDILISSINLKVLLDSADEKEALLVLQIPNNPTGIRNAKIAGVPVVDTPNLPSQDVWESVQSEYKKRMKTSSQAKSKLPQDYKSENITSFEERVNSVLDKNKEERMEGKKIEPKEEEGVGIVIDEDINAKEIKVENSNSEDLRKVDFKHVPDPTKAKPKNSSSFFSSIPNFFKKFKKEKKDRVQTPKKSVKRSAEERKEKLLRLLPRIFIPIVIVLSLVAFLYYRFAPYVRATIFIESKPVEIEKTFAGSENINEIDFENSEIPIKRETVTKSVSDTVNATGTAFRGDKATGNVTVFYIVEGDCTDETPVINLANGQRITSDSKGFLLTGTVSITCSKSYEVVGVEAVEVGEEYNLPAGKDFSVEGYNKREVYARNSSAFTGGSKEEYTVLSQKDVNGKVEELTEIAKEEAENSLKDIGSGWEIIESTIESKVKDGSIKSAVAIGTETTSSDVSLEVESSATYYYTEGVNDGLNALLTEAAINQDLFEGSEGLNLKLAGDIDKELTVNESDGKVEITLTAASSVEPSVDREDLINDLRGMKWGEGIEYLNSLTFTSDTEPTVNFYPEGFPQSLRHFPSRQGRINLSIKKVSVENS